MNNHARLDLGRRSWTQWSTQMSLLTTDPTAIAAARNRVAEILRQVELAASRFRSDTEVQALAQAEGKALPVSTTLFRLTSAALAAARETGGVLDPTVGARLVELGYNRRLRLISNTTSGESDAHRLLPQRPLQSGGREIPLSLQMPLAQTTWEAIRLDPEAQTIQVPAGLILDFGSIGKAWAADECAQIIAAELGTGVMVNLGGDIATAGPNPVGKAGWIIRVQDIPTDPAAVVNLPAGLGLATSSIRHRRWVAGGQLHHHLLDPRTGKSVRGPWAAATVLGQSCLRANTWSTAAIVLGADAPAALETQGLPARLVTAAGVVRAVAGWPADTGTKPFQEDAPEGRRA